MSKVITVAKILLRSFSNRRKLSELKEDWLRSTNEKRARGRQTKGENGDPTRVPRVILEGNYFFSNFLLRHRTLSALAGLIDTWRAVQHVFPTRLIKFNVIRQRGQREREGKRSNFVEGSWKACIRGTKTKFYTKIRLEFD